ncbi:MAG: IS110 family transposase [bacterium]
MTTEARTRIYAGLDLHGNNVVCSLRDEEGHTVVKRKVDTSLDAVMELLEPYRARIACVGVESTFNWYWLVDGLDAAGFPVVLANPAKMDQYGGIKVTNDETDAGWIAEMMRLGILPEAYVYPVEARPLRDLLRRRQLINRQCTRTILSLQSMVTRHTGQAVSSNKLKRWTRREVDATFADLRNRAAALSLVETVRFLGKQVEQLEALARAELKPDKTLQRLMTLPGIGDILGMTIRLESGPLSRFCDAGHYASYSRGVPSIRTSNNSKKGENNRKNGNRHLAWAFIEAANFAVRYSPEIKKWYERKKARSKAVIARKALACKLAKAAFYVMRDEVAFDVKKMIGT